MLPPHPRALRLLVLPLLLALAPCRADLLENFLCRRPRADSAPRLAAKLKWLLLTVRVWAGRLACLCSCMPLPA